MTAPLPILAALAAALALGACTARDPARTGATGPRFASLDAALDGGPRGDPRGGPGRSFGDGGAPAADARPATPLATLPAWIGRPLRLRERDGAEAFEQAVSLDRAPRGAARENLLLVKLPREPAAEAGTGGRPTEAGIRAELDALFPDTPMQVVTRPAKNAYGPYGLAVGRAPGGARCLYAWQWIEAAPALDPGRRPGPVSLRLRLCRADITLEAMAAAMNQIALVPRFEGAPVAAPAAAAPAGPRRHRAAHAAAASAAPRAERPVEPGPAPVERPAPGGRRYLGAVAPEAAPAATAFAGSAPASGPVAVDLPAEAVRGPTGRAAGQL